jgi:antitoxin PrlF
MAILTITSKGQVTLRKEVLRHLGLRPGDKVAVDLLPEGKAELSKAASAGGLEAFFDSLHRPGERPLSIEEINETIEKGWAGEL